MHQLFSQVLGQRDLSRAGDLFSLEDAEIEDCLSQALDQIKVISCSPVSRQNKQTGDIYPKYHLHLIIHVLIHYSSFCP